MVDRVIKFFCSLRLTVVLLTLGMFLVFWGTMAQVDLGLYQVQTRYFRSFFVDWRPSGTDWRIPIFPGGYLLGGLLLINLIAAHIKRFKLSWSKAGIFLIHAGIILLLVGQLATDLLQVESQMQLKEGQTRNYSTAAREDELAVINESNTNYDEVLAIPCALLEKNPQFSDSRIPFAISVKRFLGNSVLRNNTDGSAPVATQGIGPRVKLESREPTTDTDERDMPSAVLELKSGQTPLGTWVVSDWLDPQEVRVGDSRFKLVLRPIRYYKPYSVKLIKMTHAIYLGTDVPKDFASQVRLINPETKEDREVRIYMNNPLRYAGETFYQQSMVDRENMSVLEVVRNPGWLTPYLACLLVGGGMLWQFLHHLVRFLRKNKPVVQAALAPVPVSNARRRK